MKSVIKTWCLLMEHEDYPTYFFGTRGKYVLVRSSAAFLPPTVPENMPGNLRAQLVSMLLRDCP